MPSSVDAALQRFVEGVKYSQGANMCVLLLTLRGRRSVADGRFSVTSWLVSLKSSSDSGSGVMMSSGAESRRVTLFCMTVAPYCTESPDGAKPHRNTVFQLCNSV